VDKWEWEDKPFFMPDKQLDYATPKMMQKKSVFVAHCKPWELSEMATMLNKETHEFNQKNEAQIREYETEWPEVRRHFPEGFCVIIHGKKYYPHVFLRNEAPVVTDRESVITYDNLSEEEQTQAAVMVEFLKSQNIFAKKETIFKIARPNRVMHPALIGHGSDLASFITATELNLACPMTVTEVEFNQAYVRIVCSSGTAGKAGRRWKHNLGLLAFIIKPPLVDESGKKTVDNWICTPKHTLVHDDKHPDLMGRTLLNDSDEQAIKELVEILLQNCQLEGVMCNRCVSSDA
jgi:hypothetical protein